MPTLKRRLNVTLPNSEFEKCLTELAKQDQVPQATKLIQLAQIGLEDELWARQAEQNERESTKLISHEEAWS
jgi:hypothetical protein